MTWQKLSLISKSSSILKLTKFDAGNQQTFSMLGWSIEWQNVTGSKTSLNILQSICDDNKPLRQILKQRRRSFFSFSFYSMTILGKPMSSFLKRSSKRREKEGKIKALRNEKQKLKKQTKTKLQASWNVFKFSV